MKWIILIFLMALAFDDQAQCVSFVSTFPYTEDFEASPAWTSGGANSDWAWGAPTHPLISSAGSGTNCWCAGGLTGSFYNYSELSWLMSPCFDFTSLKYPWISFKIFWETEWKWDGVVFQYSLDGGVTWANVGAYGDQQDCLNDNWFNNDNITWLSSVPVKNGWSGRTGASNGSCLGGNGSSAWVTAKHCLSNLAGQASVRFRFFFGTGMTCNDFDGIAVDDILIEDAKPNFANFSFACGNNNTVTFINQSSPCPQQYLWNFGDPNSGASNTTGLANPSHTFSTSGIFNITLTAIGPCNAPDSVSIPITVLTVNTKATNVTCNGMNNGIITTTVTGTGGPYSYMWIPGSQTTPSLSGLSVGVYSVSVSEPNAPNSCLAVKTTTITEPPVLSVNIPSADICFGESLTLKANASGGTSGYSFFWNTGQNSNSISVSPSVTSTYIVTVTDKNGCSDTSSATVLVNPIPNISAGPDTTIWVGTTMTLTATGGGISYQWSPDEGLSCSNCSTTIATPQITTYYVVTTMNTFGCANQDTVITKVKDDLTLYVPNAFIPAHGDFYAYGIGIRKFELYVFNRWGEIIFETKDPDEGWNGTYNGQPAPADAYVYLARASSLTGISVTKTGALTLLR